MTKNTKSFALPLAFIGVMFFSLGFALGINSVLVPVLKGSLEISSAESYRCHFHPVSYFWLSGRTYD